MWLRTQVQPRDCVRVCLIFPKDNLRPHPPIPIKTRTQTHHYCHNTHTHIPRGILHFFIWAPVGACIGCSAPSSSSLFFSSSSSLSCSSLLLLSPLSLPLSQPSFPFFSSSILCVQVESDGGTGATLPSLCSFNNSTVSILMLIWLLQPSQCRFVSFSLSLFFFILCLFSCFSSTAPNAAREGRKRSGDKKGMREDAQK